MKSVDEIKIVLANKKYRFFDTGAYNLNIIGVRSANRTANAFDDDFYFIYRDGTNQQIVKHFKGTTDPGLDSLQKCENSKGCAIMVPGQYVGLWKLGLHKGQYEALVQSNPVKVYRDGDKDAILDLNHQTIDSGIFGINFHHANMTAVSTLVGGWSAGCQVLNNPADFAVALDLCKKSAEKYGNSFTYTLIEECDFK